MKLITINQIINKCNYRPICSEFCADPKFTIPLTSTYTRVGIFSEGLAPVYSYVSNNDDNLKFGYINKTGKLVIPMNFSKPYGGKYDDQEHSFKNGKAYVMNFKGNSFCIDKIGKKVNCK